jgi:transposase
MSGYSLETVEAIRKANGRLLGVKLGRACLRRRMPVSEVAEFFDVSRVTVYNWFKGTAVVSDKHTAQVKKLIEKLS